MAASSSPGTPAHVLVFSKTTPDAYRHESIPAGIDALEQLSASTAGANGGNRQIQVTATEDASVFTPSELAQYEVIVFLQAGGDFLDAAQLDALKGFVAEGKGVVGIHAATTGMPTRRHDASADADGGSKEKVEVVDAEGWYGRLLGAEFAQHPEPQWGEVRVREPEHPIMRQAVSIVRQSNGGLAEQADPCTSTGDDRWKWFDEWYNFKEDPRHVVGDGIIVLLTVDEKSYDGGTMAPDHAIAWCHQRESSKAQAGGARVFYTALGHFDEAYRDDAFIAHVRDGILWSAKRL